MHKLCLSCNSKGQVTFNIPLQNVVDEIQSFQSMQEFCEAEKELSLVFKLVTQIHCTHQQKAALV